MFLIVIVAVFSTLNSDVRSCLHPSTANIFPGSNVPDGNKNGWCILGRQAGRQIDRQADGQTGRRAKQTDHEIFDIRVLVSERFRFKRLST